MRKATDILLTGIFLLAILTCSCIFTAKAHAQKEAVTKPIDMALAKKYIANMLDLADKKPANYRLDVNAMLDYTIHALRGPYTDGSGYKFAGADIKNNSSMEKIGGGKIVEIFDLGKKQTFTGEARITNALQISLPKYRSALFKNNGDAYIHSYTVEYTIDGKKFTIAKEFKNWLGRNNTLDIPLPGIAEWAKIEVLASVAPADLEKTNIELHAAHPEIKDDPANPFSYPLDQLFQIKHDFENMKSEDIAKRLNEAARGIDAVPAALGADLPPDKQMAQKLNAVIDLLDSNSVDQAKQDLKGIVEALK